MREIKFRVWDKVESKLFSPVYEAYNGRLLDLSISLSGELLRRTLENPCEHQSLFPDRYVVMQFTGWKDKNGNEIYEGDLIMAYKSGPYEVIWQSHSGQWIMQSVKDGRGYRQMAYDYAQIDYEIIGNIYQHPHLIN